MELVEQRRLLSEIVRVGQLADQVGGADQTAFVPLSW